MARRPGLELFTASFLLLLLELACIRWFPAHVLFLTFFTNIVLLASFLGMSIGLLTAGRRGDALAWTPVVLLGAAAIALAIESLGPGLKQVVEVAGSDVVYFGTERMTPDLPPFVVPIEVLGGFFFVAIALAMMGPGQAMGRAFDRIENRLHAYSINIAGSLAGISLFSLLSWWETPPLAWFGVAALLFVLLRPPGRWRSALCLAPLVPLLLLMHLAASDRANPTGGVTRQLWSPYYRVEYSGPPRRQVRVNLIGHQHMSAQSEPGFRAYALPHELNRAAGRAPFKRVLIIGAGTGNDVSQALRQGAERVDAVEIDPVIQRLGALEHPDRPYADPRVRVHIGDGRGFLATNREQYDLVVYALVDSLVLHSGYSNIRLESFLFTREALADARRALAPDGVLVLYNFYRKGWIVARLHKQLDEVFAAPPLVLSSPEREFLDENSEGGVTVLFAGDTGAIATLLGSGATSLPGADPLPRPSEVRMPARLPVASDEWPFLYLRRPMLPGLSLKTMAVMGGLAFLMLVVFRAFRPAGMAPSPTGLPLFLLGAGFMLLETRAVVQLALLFGSTWWVNSLVFFAILVMILLANLLVLRLRPRHLGACFVALLASIALGMLLEPRHLVALPRAQGAAIATAVVFLPIVFAGIAFAVLFSRSRTPDRDLGANVAGAMLGGLAENLSMLVGFRWLGLVAMAIYGLAALFRERGTNTGTAVGGHSRSQALHPGQSRPSRDGLRGSSRVRSEVLARRGHA